MIISFCFHCYVYVTTEINEDKPDSQSLIKARCLFSLAVEYKLGLLLNSFNIFATKEFLLNIYTFYTRADVFFAVTLSAHASVELVACFDQ